MLGIRPYKACDARTITKWLKDEYTFRQWSADRYQNYPITADEMNKYYDNDKYRDDIWAMTAFDASGIVGHFTMRFTNCKRDEIRMGFVIVDDNKRGKGYGKNMISLAVRYAFDFIGVQKVSLGVFENNSSAIKCYKACGFIAVEKDNPESYICMNENWNCIEMQIKKL